MIVQDLAKEIDGRALSEGVEGMAYDFMEPQPVKGIHPFTNPSFLQSPFYLPIHLPNPSTPHVLYWGVEKEDQD